MKYRFRKIAAMSGVVALSLALMVPAIAAAHVTVSPSEAPADGYAKLDISVPHGCEGAATNKVIVQIPDGVTSVTPQVVPGWEITTKTGDLAEPVDSHGETITEGVREVTWTGGPLPDHMLEVFGMSVKFDGTAGDTAYFKAIQECEGGLEAAWIEEPAAGQSADDLEMPAPAVMLTAASDDHHGDDANAADDAAATSGSDSTDSNDDDDGDGNTVGIIALVLGAAGTLMGGIALGRKRQ